VACITATSAKRRSPAPAVRRHRSSAAAQPVRSPSSIVTPV
jgi:hypothetical protein